MRRDRGDVEIAAADFFAPSGVVLRVNRIRERGVRLGFSRVDLNWHNSTCRLKQPLVDNGQLPREQGGGPRQIE